MSRPADFYDVLALPHDCSREQIRDAYLVLARKYHPDVAADKADAHGHFIEIGKAYHALYDPKAREEYDRKLRSAPKGASPPIVAVAQPAPQVAAAVVSSVDLLRREPTGAAAHDDRFNQPGWNWKAGTKMAGTMPVPTSSRPTRPLERPAPPVDIPATPASPSPTKPLTPPAQPDDRGGADLLRQARAELRRNQWTAAERLCLNYLALDPRSVEGLETLGDIHANSGRKADAIRCYRNALKVLPGNEIIEAKIDCLRCTDLFPDPDAPPKPHVPSREAEHEAPKRSGWGGFGIANWLSDRFR
jgi:curved DNA-binding protein CbpA